MRLTLASLWCLIRETQILPSIAYSVSFVDRLMSNSPDYHNLVPGHGEMGKIRRRRKVVVNEEEGEEEDSSDELRMCPTCEELLVRWENKFAHSTHKTCLKIKF